MLLLSFIAGWLYGWFLFVFVRHMSYEPKQKHWSEQDWWTGRDANRYLDLQETDRPHLFD